MHDILDTDAHQHEQVSSNFERLLWYLAYDTQDPNRTNDVQQRRQAACSMVKEWQSELKTKGGFSVDKKVLEAAKNDFTSERVSDTETLSTIRDVYRHGGYVLDPHSAIGVTAAQRSAKAAPGPHLLALATAHPAKFSVSPPLVHRQSSTACWAVPQASGIAA